MITPAATPPSAPDQMPVSTFSITDPNPFAPERNGSVQPIAYDGDPDPAGRDDVAATVAGAQASAEARFREHMGDTYAQGSQIGDTMHLPPVTTTGSHGGSFYDPPRDY